MFKDLLNIFEGFENDLRTCRNTSYARTCRVENGVQDRRVRRIQRSFAAACSTVRSVGTRVILLVYKLNIVRNVVGIRNTALEKAGVYLEIFKIFRQCKTDALC